LQAVIIYNDGRPADVLSIDSKKLERYWNLWLQRLQLFRSKQEFRNPLNSQTVEF
jgi:hypothetical protein